MFQTMLLLFTSFHVIFMTAMEHSPCIKKSGIEKLKQSCCGWIIDEHKELPHKAHAMYNSSALEVKHMDLLVHKTVMKAAHIQIDNHTFARTLPTGFTQKELEEFIEEHLAKIIDPLNYTILAVEIQFELQKVDQQKNDRYYTRKAITKTLYNLAHNNDINRNS